ncbi:acyl CoA:acetate/3-ketoacid CoA transferase alpha subunit [Streptomyces sp. B3I7]|uniref:CoA-transferase n=1 Tax=Streptomyces sp. B3I7 TaxID=3042269 RepID=UPI002783150C|nr:CoA-transferase [Streptomyces sp. B3I7]MDQ0814809.1 acyl CoA:acetate/3-ketoacid CoA transferase alpha subunit [Streptomyces sp. B3I7]
MDKAVPSAAQAVADITEGSSLAVGGFGLCGIPATLSVRTAAPGVSPTQVLAATAAPVHVPAPTGQQS